MAAAEQQLNRRLTAAAAAVAQLLDEAAPASPAESIALLLKAVDEPHAAAAEAEAQAAHEQGLANLRGRFERRAEALARVGDAVADLREVTSPPAMLVAAPRRLCEASELDRVLLSTVEDGSMSVRAAFFRDDPEGAEATVAALADSPIKLEHPLIEAEMLRRHRATVVTDAQLQPRVSAELNQAMGWRSYTVAPVSIRSRVLAVIHADRRSEPLDIIHREVLWRFAAGLAQAHESASLRRTLRDEREQVRHFLDRLDARLAELSSGVVALTPPEPVASPPTPIAEQHGSVALGGVLTRREQEVLQLLAEGMSNRGIANLLVLSEGTVKFHVNSILRKLRASNRAEAVSRYLIALRSSA